MPRIHGTQKIEAQVKEEVELMSVLARLAGYEEYGFDYARGYTADIDSVLGNSVRMKPWK